MLKVAMLALGASLTIAAVAPNQASAQLSGRQRTGRTTSPTTQPRQGGVIYSDDNRCYDDRYDKTNRRHDDDDDDDRYEGRDRDRPNRPHDNGKHKGWYKHGKKGNRCDTVYNNRGTMGTIGDIILRRPRYDQSNLGYGTLQQILGSGVLSRIDQARYQLGYNGQLTGRWYDVSNGSELDLFANGLQIAQILDRNRDGRADVFRWTNGR